MTPSVQARRPRHVVLIGHEYRPDIGTGDKNFWARLLPLLAEGLDRVTILSVTRERRASVTDRVSGCDVSLRYVPVPPLARNRWRPQSVGRGGFLLEKLASTPLLWRELARLRRSSPFRHVHLMDNFGPANRPIAWVARRSQATASVSAIAFEGGPRSYEAFIRLSYRWGPLTVVPYSMALRDRLRRLGVPDRSMRHIPWGVLPPSEAADVSADLRPVLGLPRDRPVYLWAGFIQQIREQDFRFAYRTALAALSKGLAASFVFAFKPEVWRSDFADLARPDEGIHTMATDAERFAELKRAADVFYSPVVRRDCIIAPPLTWIEMMALGRPIITTSVQGADELVEHARTGYLAEDESTLIEHLFRIRDDPHAMREACRGAVSKRYNLLDIRDRYLRLWLGADA